MPRTRQFDRDGVVETAMNLFWLYGYDATSIQDLVDATGVERGSLYHAFNSKAGLFAAALDHYSGVHPAQTILGCPESDPPRATIERFFTAIAGAS